MRGQELPLLAAPYALGQATVGRSLAWLEAMAHPRTPYTASTLTPDDPAIDRHSLGSWTGTWTMPVDPHPGPSPTPVLVTGPLWFPVMPGRRADFQGRVDVPFASLDGWVGTRYTAPGVPDPATRFADGGINWGSYFVVGSVAGATAFVARVAPNYSWAATVADAPPGDWEFQLVTYADAADAAADDNRIAVGNPWRQSERPGDVRDWYGQGYTAHPPQFSAVTVTRGATNLVTGTLEDFASTPGRTYRVLATDETDVEYAWAWLADAAPGPFTIESPNAIGGKVKLRLLEQVAGCSVRQVGIVWAEENAADAAALPDLRVEYRALAGPTFPFFPASVQPAQLDHTWSVPLAGGGASGNVRLVDLNGKRVLGEWTMPSGLMRSYIVPPAEAGQDTTSVYYDGFMGTCFLYDQAVALIALLQAGRQQAAARLVDALLAVQNPDGSFPFANDQAVLGSHNAGFIRTGAVAWVAYALLLADTPPFRAWFATRPDAAARACLDYILGYRNALGLVTGGKGQYVAGVLDPAYVVPWWSTEHNVDTWWCLDLADQLYGSGTVDYRGAADTIQASLSTYGWDAAHGVFWQGGGHTVDSEPDGAHALDTHTWGAMLLHKWGRSADAAVSIARAYRHYYLTDRPSGLSGFTTFIPLDGYPADMVLAPWYEGGFGMVAALRLADPPRAIGLMATLARGQRPDGSYLYALATDTLNDIHPWPCLIASAWNLLAWSGRATSMTRIFWQ
jgi:hypothetical protein